MTSERWQLVKKLAADALELEPSDRVGFVQSAAGTDEDVKTEALRLIQLDAEPSHPILKPSIWQPEGSVSRSNESNDDKPEPPAFKPGQLLCDRFVITGFIGRGGMGEVYAAWDQELRDSVAVKTIRATLGSDSIVDRFRKEVLRARQISHPNICRVHDLFQHNDAPRKIWFLTMELLAGSTLGEYIAKNGKLKSETAAIVVRQLADGLSAAHKVGIIHRDLKPGNVMLVENPAGIRAVITDFGLAHPATGREVDGQPALVSGTPRYMAPEQLERGAVSPATDVYSFGMVVRELVDPSEWNSRIAGASCSWRDFIARCTEPNAARRLRSALEVRALLERARLWGGRRLVAALLAIALVPVAGVMWYEFARERNPKMHESTRITQNTGLATTGAISPDGSLVAYSSDEAEDGNLDIWVRNLKDGNPRRITSDPREDLYPTLSTDNRWVAYRSERAGGGIYMAGTSGDAERLVVPQGRDPIFSRDGKYLAYSIGAPDDESVTGSKIFIINLSSRQSTPIHPEFTDARHPAWSPDGRSILFQGRNNGKGPNSYDWWLTPVDGGQARAAGAAKAFGPQKIPVQVGMLAWWRDRILFHATQGDVTTIWEAAITGNGRVAHPPRRLSQNTENQMFPSVSADGKLLYSTLRFEIGTWRLATDTGANVPHLVTGSLGNDTHPSVSRDGYKLAFRRKTSGFRNIWIKDLHTGREIALTASDTEKLLPTLRGDGGMVAFSESGQNGHSLFTVNVADRSVRNVCRSCGDPQDWHPSGESLMIGTGTNGAVQEISVKTGEQRVILNSEHYLVDSARYSPDGNWIAFTARQGGTARIFAAPVSDTAEKRWMPVSEPTAWNDAPAWQPDGSGVYFRSNSDGFFCLYYCAFHLSPMAAASAIKSVHHFHSHRLNFDPVPPSAFNLTVTRGSLFFTAADIRGNVWSSRLEY